MKRPSINGEKRAKRNIDADVLTAFQFSDLLTTIRKSGLHNRFGCSTQTQWRNGTSGLTAFRDQVMHPTSEFLGARTIEDLIAIEAMLRTLLIAASQYPAGHARQVAGMSSRTQRVTDADIAAGRIRVPAATKPMFPSTRGTVAVILRGMAMTVAYNPRNGPDRARSGVLRIGRGPLAGRVRPDERLMVTQEDGVIHLE